MSTIIDRRKNPKGKSFPNRQRFIKRVEKQIKDAIPDIVNDKDIDDLSDDTKRIKVPIDGIEEPEFTYDKHPPDDVVLPGNDKYTEGDLIPKPPGGDGNGDGNGARDGDDVEDPFIVDISREEFIDYFFKNLELPDVVKKSLEKTPDYEWKRSGYTNEGVPAKMNIEESVKKAIGRNIAIKGVYDAEIEELEEKKKKETDPDKIKEIEERIEELKSLRDVIPFIDEFDLKYNNHKKKPIPSTSCVMFCLMDVSLSMGKPEKEIAKRFFMLLYIFLTREYENIEIVFIRHTTTAEEVDEKEFFQGTKSGGTKVKSALDLTKKIIKERYSDDNRNLYISQAGDGDVWSDGDGQPSAEMVDKELLPLVQFMCYLEIRRKPESVMSNPTVLSDFYAKINSDKFNQQKVSDSSEIWPVFKKFFRKRD